MKNIEDLSIVKKHYNGKVRDIYDLGEKLLIVTSDRISAFDVVFPNIIKNKGKILNQISVNFFKNTKNIIENHFITDNINEYPKELHDFKEILEDRSMLVKKTRVIPFECIVRGYITGSAWKEYKKNETVADLTFEHKLEESEKFPNPIFTPSTKSDTGHDINISYNQMTIQMDKKLAEQIKNISINLYNYAHEYLKERDIIIADTKFEFGTIGNKLILIDEIITPDSSRFWDKNEYKLGTTPKSYDKQFIRDYLSCTDWNKQPPAPRIPDEIIEKTYNKYYQAYKVICDPKVKKWD